MPARGSCPAGRRVEAGEFISANVYSVALLSSPRGHSDAHRPIRGEQFAFSGVQVEAYTSGGAAGPCKPETTDRQWNDTAKRGIALPCCMAGF